MSDQQKARKDRRQSAQLLEVLLADRPADVGKAWRQLPGAMTASVRRAIRQFDDELRRAIGETVQDTALSRR